HRQSGNRSAHRADDRKHAELAGSSPRRNAPTRHRAHRRNAWTRMIFDRPARFSVAAPHSIGRMTRAVAALLSVGLLMGVSLETAEARARAPAPRKLVIPPYRPSKGDTVTTPATGEELPAPEVETAPEPMEPPTPPPMAMPMPRAPAPPASSLPAPPPPLGPPPAAATGPLGPDSTIVALIQSLVQQGVLTQDRAG